LAPSLIDCAFADVASNANASAPTQQINLDMNFPADFRNDTGTNTPMQCGVNEKRC
jgi:hypothetical protein